MDANDIRPSSHYDVIIVGAGPAGCMANLCLTTYGFSVLQIDERPETTQAGRADGIQPRTIEVLRNIGGVLQDEKSASLAKRMIKQGVRVYEVAFWDPTPDKPLARTSRAPSCPSFIDVNDNYTLLLHQGLIERAFLDETQARRALLPADKNIPAPHGNVFRPYKFDTCSTDEAASPDYPVTAHFHHVTTGEKLKVQGKYLLGVDGAKSLVRRAISGGQEGDGEWKGKITMVGDASDIIWGVMDVEVKTNFPDIQAKCLIHSKSDGSIMVIPRESGLVRLYVQLQESLGPDGKQKHYGRDAGEEICKARAQKIFEPYKLEFGRTDWFSVYQIGQRIASKYTMDHRVFLGGDATHTHSPKAGQGMNISMLDMYTLAWKLNLVEKGLADRSILLPTYEQERKSVAEELLAFDKAYSTLFSGRSPKADQLTADVTKAKSLGAVDAELFIETFKKNAFFTSGCGAIYFANVLNALPDAELVAKYPKKGVFNPEGTRLVAGQRLLPGKVTRAVDANQVRIHQEVKMNGAFRIHVLAGEYQQSKPRLAALDRYLDSPKSFLNLYRPKAGVNAATVYNTHSDRHIEPEQKAPNYNPFFDFLYVFASSHEEWDIEDLPYNVRIYRENIYSDDLFDSRVGTGVKASLHAKWGVPTNRGGIVVVRPDGYVGAVVTLDADGFEALDAYFAGFLKSAKAVKGKSLPPEVVQARI
ncbi:phenol 2-monooxygenase [Gonapodya prolifera JEL478]|uniref:Phenol 2-monooxygenase n=1 Tax=Gonapodya prolifera (strain JEL478) TaxID=1344416 RepID=A0A139AMC6_GONPJ|nr:phenol 2-monooxygenase [Gonapodya prolifera JEL478]|eukprot:KXS17858.1 phenol 2-monooxygenase [Gonapodya prolifera JEL478]